METPGRRIPAGGAVALRLGTGDRLRLVNTHGSQVVDCWAFALPGLAEFMSMEHSRVELARVSPRVGDSLFTNRRRPALTLLEDSSPGVHDTTLAACDVHRYQRLGFAGYHPNCTDNLRESVGAEGLALPCVPCPLNFWENAPVRADGAQVIAAPVSRPGDHVLLRAELDLLLVLSACPQDLVPTNGAAGVPTEVHFGVEGARRHGSGAKGP